MIKHASLKIKSPPCLKKIFSRNFQKPLDKHAEWCYNGGTRNTESVAKYNLKRGKMMKRSERLAKEGKIEVNCGSIEVATVVSKSWISRRARASMLRYIGTDFEALYDGREVSADIYEDELNDGGLFAVIQ